MWETCIIQNKLQGKEATFYENNGNTNNISESETSITMVVQPIIFVNDLLTYFPMIFLLLISKIIQIKTTGSRIPLITCDQMLILISGAFGMRIMAAARISIPVYKK